MPFATDELINKLNSPSTPVTFDEVMSVISANYTYKESAFKNGDLVNEAGSNEGSCKIFAFAKLNNLSEQATLNCFGHFYHEDVLNHPMGNDHGNIRNFIKYGWAGVTFETIVLHLK